MDEDILVIQWLERINHLCFENRCKETVATRIFFNPIRERRLQDLRIIDDLQYQGTKTTESETAGVVVARESLEVNSAQALSMDLCAHALASARCVPSRR